MSFTEESEVSQPCTDAIEKALAAPALLSMQMYSNEQGPWQPECHANVNGGGPEAFLRGRGVILIQKPKSFCPVVCVCPRSGLHAPTRHLLGLDSSCWLEAQHQDFPWRFAKFGSSCPQWVKSPLDLCFSRGLTSLVNCKCRS